MAADVDIEWNKLNGMWLDGCCNESVTGAFAIKTTGSITVKYNDIEGWNQDPIAMAGGPSSTIKFDNNFGYGMVNRAGSGAHTRNGRNISSRLDRQFLGPKGTITLSSRLPMVAAVQQTCGLVTERIIPHTFAFTKLYGRFVTIHSLLTQLPKQGETVTGWIDDGTGTYASPGGPGNFFTVHSTGGTIGSFGNKASLVSGSGLTSPAVPTGADNTHSIVAVGQSAGPSPERRVSTRFWRPNNSIPPPPFRPPCPPLSTFNPTPTPI